MALDEARAILEPEVHFQRELSQKNHGNVLHDLKLAQTLSRVKMD